MYSTYPIVCPEAQIALQNRFADDVSISRQYVYSTTLLKDNTNERQHDKTNKMTVRPVKTQISLGIRQSDQSLHCALSG